MAHWWQDPAVDAKLAVVYADTILVLLGIFGYVFFLRGGNACFTGSLSRWEYVRSFDVEYAIIRRRLPFRWYLVSGRVFARS